MKIVPDLTREATLSLEQLPRPQTAPKTSCLKSLGTREVKDRAHSQTRRKSVTFRDEEQGGELADVKTFKPYKGVKNSCCVIC